MNPALTELPFSLVFSRFLSRIAHGQSSELIQKTAALLCDKVEMGHTRLRLNNLAGNDEFPLLEEWEQLLETSGLAGDGQEITPLVLQRDNESVYLSFYRHYAAEKDLARQILARSVLFDPQPLPQTLTQYFPAATNSTDWQAIAAACALKRKFCVITGGPGTGKTTTVAKVIHLLKEQNPEESIALAAPTGKAAQRLEISLQHQEIHYPAQTLHRLLGLSRAKPRFTRENPLPQDTVIVDEASMIDLEVMGYLFAALREEARLILLGDENQLASVEAGSVLHDICKGGSEFPETFCNELKAVGIVPPPSSPQTSSALSGCIVRLQHSWRFDAHKGIGQLAGAVLNGAVLPEVLENSPEAEFIPFSEQLLNEWLDAQINQLQNAPDFSDAFSVLEQNRILCPTRTGPRGLSAIDHIATHLLQSLGVRRYGKYFHRQPLLIEQNDYTSQLFNGETVVVDLTDPQTVMVRHNDGRIFPLEQLPQHRPAWALTIHKSQGSEFGHVLFILPGIDSPLASRELAYTAVTRARNKVTLTGESISELQNCATTPHQRQTGLAGLLHG